MQAVVGLRGPVLAPRLRADQHAGGNERPVRSGVLMVDFTDVTVPGTTLVTFSIDPPIAVPANFVLTSPLVPMSVGYLDVSTTGVPHRAHHHLRFDEGVQGFLPASPVIESCEAKGATKYARTTAAVSGCASCLDGRAGLLASRLGTFADQMNGSIYCDGAVSFP